MRTQKTKERRAFLRGESAAKSEFAKRVIHPLREYLRPDVPGDELDAAVTTVLADLVSRWIAARKLTLRHDRRLRKPLTGKERI